MALDDDIPGVMLVLIPRPSMPDHIPMYFGAPFSLSIPPHKPFKCEGNLAKALHCEFPDMFFLANEDGTHRPFPSDKAVSKDVPSDIPSDVPRQLSSPLEPIPLPVHDYIPKVKGRKV